MAVVLGGSNHTDLQGALDLSGNHHDAKLVFQLQQRRLSQNQTEQGVYHVESAIEEPHIRLELSSSCYPWKASDVNLLHSDLRFHSFSRARQQQHVRGISPAVRGFP